MREIKFRAWNKRRKRIYTVLSLHTATVMNGGIWATVEGRDVIEDKDIHIQVQPKDIEVMQYTGINDRNGKNIFDGDIVALDGFDSHGDYGEFKDYYKGTFKVFWDADTAQFSLEVIEASVYGWDLTIDSREDLTVIGNIYENPDLLELALAPPSDSITLTK